MIQATITFHGTEEQLDLLLNKNGYTGIKPKYDATGELVYENIQYLKDENDEFVLDDEKNKIVVSLGEPATEPMSKAEYLSHLIKHLCIMPVVRETTARLEYENGILHYNSKAMNAGMEQLIEVESIVE